MSQKNGKSHILLLTPEEFRYLGLDRIAYIKPITSPTDEATFSIHAATGEMLARASTFQAAWHAIEQHDLRPLMVH